MRPRRLAARLGREVAALFGDARTALRSGRRPVVAGLMCLVAIVCAAIGQDPSARGDLDRAGDVYARLPLGHELLRMPLSVFLPTSDLPLWGAILQLAVVIGLAELLLGRWPTLLVALAGELIPTLGGRLLIELGSGSVVGLPFSESAVLDTGPSGVCTAVGAWMLVRRRAWVSIGLLTVVLAVFTLVQSDLTGREHALALVVGLAAGALQTPPMRRLARRVVCLVLRLEGGSRRTTLDRSRRGTKDT